jgi:YVTN family beta-propeller protein
VSAEPPAPPQLSPDGRFYWDGEKWVPVEAQIQAMDAASRLVPPGNTQKPTPGGLISGDGRWSWDGAAWRPRSPRNSPWKIWLRRVSLIGSFGGLALALLYALDNMWVIHEYGNVPGYLLLAALIVSVILWLLAVVLGWRWRQRRLFPLIWVLIPVWLGANYVSIEAGCLSCQWTQGAQVAQTQMGEFNYVGWRVDTNAKLITVADGRVWTPDFDGSGLWVYSAETGQAYIGDWLGWAGLGDGPLSIASYGGHLWVVSPLTAMVYEVDPKLPLFKAPVARFRLGGRPALIAAGTDALWITDNANDRLLRFDPSSGNVVATINVGSPNDALVASDGNVWVASYSDNTISRIDPSTNRIAQVIQVGSGPRFLLETPGAIWSSNNTGDSVSRLDLATMHVTEVKVGKSPAGLASADGHVWVANIDSRDISLLDPASGQLIRTLTIGPAPWSFAVDGTTVWVATYEDQVLGRFTPR